MRHFGKCSLSKETILHRERSPLRNVEKPLFSTCSFFACSRCLEKCNFGLAKFKKKIWLEKGVKNVVWPPSLRPSPLKNLKTAVMPGKPKKGKALPTVFRLTGKTKITDDWILWQKAAKTGRFTRQGTILDIKHVSLTTPPTGTSLQVSVATSLEKSRLVTLDFKTFTALPTSRASCPPLSPQLLAVDDRTAFTDLSQQTSESCDQ